MLEGLSVGEQVMLLVAVVYLSFLVGYLVCCWRCPTDESARATRAKREGRLR